MNVRTQTIAIIALVSLCLIVGLGLFTQAFILEGFVSLEEELLEETMESTVGTIDLERQYLASTVTNWAEWDDTYLFIQGNNPNFIEKSLVDGIFSYYHLHSIIITHVDGEIVFARGFDPDAGKAISIPPSLFSLHEILMQSGGRSISGIYQTEDGPMRVAIGQILMSGGEGPVMGTVLFARFIDDGWVERLSDHIGLPAQISILSEKNSGITKQEQIIIRNPDTITGSRILNDIFSNPLLTLSVTQERTIYKKGIISYQLALIAIVSLGLTAGILIYLLINRSFLKRISNLNSEVQDITEKTINPESVEIIGNDEVSELARSINGMLKSIEDDQRVIRESEERYRLLFNAAQDFILLVELDSDKKPGEILYANTAAIQALGMQKTEVVGLRLSNVFFIDDDGERSDRAFINGRFKPIYGAPVPVEVSMHAFTLNNKPAAIWVARDISERMRVEKERAASIEQLSHNIDQFAILGDNIRNPLQVIRGYLALLDLQKEYISVIEEQIEIIDDRINQLDAGWLDSENVIKFMRRHRKE